MDGILSTLYLQNAKSFCEGRWRVFLWGSAYTWFQDEINWYQPRTPDKLYTPIKTTERLLLYGWVKVRTVIGLFVKKTNVFYTTTLSYSKGNGNHVVPEMDLWTHGSWNINILKDSQSATWGILSEVLTSRTALDCSDDFDNFSENRSCISYGSRDNVETIQIWIQTRYPKRAQVWVRFFWKIQQKLCTTKADLDR